ncbi:MAG: AraC family transcriptional regulator [Alphaproteobacteria bacterium]|nr:AraC family transcriptional regulator [Alphaproteobacteria bacterium]
MPHKLLSPAKPVAEMVLLNLSVVLCSNENIQHKFRSDRFYFIGMVLSADAEFTRTIDGQLETGAIKRGDIFITPPHADIHWSIKGKVNCASVCIDIDYILNVAASVGIAIHPDMMFKKVFKHRDPLVESLFQAIVEKVYETDALSVLYVETMARALCIQLLHTLLEEPEHHGFQKTLPLKRIETLRAFVVNNLDKRISNKELASHACVSQFHFCRLFKRTLGITPQQFVRRCRLDHAKALVQGSNQTVAEIAYGCGFATQSHFTHLFRQSFGLSPRQMRVKILNDAQLTIFDRLEEKQADAQLKQSHDIVRQTVELLD